jgi:hypothetical protein
MRREALRPGREGGLQGIEPSEKQGTMNVSLKMIRGSLPSLKRTRFMSGFVCFVARGMGARAPFQQNRLECLLARGDGEVREREA